MSNDDTFIEQPPPQQPPPSEPPSLPPMPPPPGPPVRKRTTGLLAAIIGGVILILCLVAGFGIWRLIQGGTFSFGGEDENPDPAALTQTAVAGEVQEIEILTDTPVPQPTDTQAPTDNPLPTDTALPTEIPGETFTPTSSVPTFTAAQAGFCRLGPSTIYPEIRTLNAGDSRPILGRSISPVDGVSVWWEIEISGLRCYISSDLGTVSGDTSGVPLREAPPTPTPTPTPTHTPTATPTATP